MEVELIETKRLKGEKINQSHWKLWLELGVNLKVMATLGGIWSDQQAQVKMNWNGEQWKQYGHGQWMFFEKNTGLFVGRGGIRRVLVKSQEEVELGYVLMSEYWGKELAVEIGEKALSIAFDQFHYSSVVGYALVENQPSQRVMQKLGFIFEDNLVKAGKPHVLYRYQNPRCDRKLSKSTNPK